MSSIADVMPWALTLTFGIISNVCWWKMITQVKAKLPDSPYSIWRRNAHFALLRDHRRLYPDSLLRFAWGATLAGVLAVILIVAVR